MSDNFKETVNLKDRMTEMEEKRKVPARKRANKTEEIDKLYEPEKTKKNTEFKQINRPKNEDRNSTPHKGLVFILLIVIIVLSFFVFIKNKNNVVDESVQVEEKWSIVTLSNGKIYYGLVGDKTADPLVIGKVYSNYDKEVDPAKNDTTGIKLFKQNEEIDVIRSQIESIQSLDIKPEILKAILAHEE